MDGGFVLCEFTVSMDKKSQIVDDEYHFVLPIQDEFSNERLTVKKTKFLNGTSAAFLSELNLVEALIMHNQVKIKSKIRKFWKCKEKLENVNGFVIAPIMLKYCDAHITASNTLGISLVGQDTLSVDCCILVVEWNKGLVNVWKDDNILYNFKVYTVKVDGPKGVLKAVRDWFKDYDPEKRVLCVVIGKLEVIGDLYVKQLVQNWKVHFYDGENKKEVLGNIGLWFGYGVGKITGSCFNLNVLNYVSIIYANKPGKCIVWIGIKEITLGKVFCWIGTLQSVFEKLKKRMSYGNVVIFIKLKDWDKARVAVPECFGLVVVQPLTSNINHLVCLQPQKVKLGSAFVVIDKIVWEMDVFFGIIIKHEPKNVCEYLIKFAGGWMDFNGSVFRLSSKEIKALIGRVLHAFWKVPSEVIEYLKY